MSKSNKFSPEVRERAVRMVQEHRGEYSSRWAAIESIAPRSGCVPQTLNEWVKRKEERFPPDFFSSAHKSRTRRGGHKL